MIEALSTIFSATVPVLIYCLIIWLTMPYKTISIKQLIVYLSFGFISIGVLEGLWLLFPSYFADTWKLDFLGDEMQDMLYTHTYWRVGFPEEISKWLAFLAIQRWMAYEYPEERNPIGCMFYCGVTALSFGLLENIEYATAYGDQVLFIRTFTSLIFHFLCGLTIGYWVAMGEQKFDNRSIAGVLLNKYSKLKRIIYTLVGITIAAYVHGTYDFSLYMAGPLGAPLMFTVLGVYTFILYVAAKHLIALTQDKK